MHRLRIRRTVMATDFVYASSKNSSGLSTYVALLTPSATSFDGKRREAEWQHSPVDWRISAERAPTSASRCVECYSKGQSWSGDSWSAEQRDVSHICSSEDCWSADQGRSSVKLTSAEQRVTFHVCPSRDRGQLYPRSKNIKALN